MSYTPHLKTSTMKKSSLLTILILVVTIVTACNKAEKSTTNQLSNERYTNTQDLSSRKAIELSKLETYCQSGNSAEYFKNSDWKVLFDELEEKDVAEILNKKLFMYQTEDVTNPGGHIYIVSSSPNQNGVTTRNSLAGWAY